MQCDLEHGIGSLQGGFVTSSNADGVPQHVASDTAHGHNTQYVSHCAQCASCYALHDVAAWMDEVCGICAAKTLMPQNLHIPDLTASTHALCCIRCREVQQHDA
jgi:hypothetical protein